METKMAVATAESGSSSSGSSSSSSSKYRTLLAQWAQQNCYWPPTYSTRSFTGENGPDEVFYISTACIEGLTHPGGFSKGIGHTGGFAASVEDSQERAAYESISAILFAEEQLEKPLNEMPCAVHFLYDSEGHVSGTRLLASGRDHAYATTSMAAWA
jgi:hypothetical protein